MDSKHSEIVSVSIKQLNNDNPIMNDYICSVCRNIYEDPVQVIKCGHNTCTKCAEKWTEYTGNFSFSCPECRVSSDWYPDTRLKRSIDNLIIKCKCDKKISFSKIRFHIENECELFSYNCSLCSKDILIKDSVIHNNNCESASVMCDLCYYNFAKKDIDAHKKIHNIHVQCPICTEQVHVDNFHNHSRVHAVHKTIPNTIIIFFEL
jgi:Zinc finger, C3HC4 type (RING finger)